MKNIFLVLFTLLINLGFSQEEILVIDKDSEPNEMPFAVIEEIPVFPGCEEVERSDRMKCFNLKMNEHVKKHFIYPPKAQKKNIQGRVYVQFIIDKEGNVVDVQTRGADPILQTEARRIFSLLPKMKPGIQKGKPVNVRYTMPLSFNLR